MPYQLTSKTTGKVTVITDEQYKNALEVPGFNSLFKSEPIASNMPVFRKLKESDLPPAKMVRKKSELDAPEPETPTDEQDETDTTEQS